MKKNSSIPAKGNNQKKENPANQNLSKMNLSEFRKIADKMEFREKKEGFSRNEGDLIYKYPPSWNQIDRKLNGRNFREGCRKKMKSYAERIGLFLKKGRNEDLENEIKSFLAFYKEKYMIQDFSISPFKILIQNDESLREKISLMMKISQKYAMEGKENPAKRNPARKRNPAKRNPAKDKKEGNPDADQNPPADENKGE